MGRQARAALRVVGVVCVLMLAVVTAAPARAQSWVQIEALPSLQEGEERARAYAGVFANVAGFSLSSGWYAIVLGPFADAEALRQLEVLKGERLIPADSYIADAGRFRGQFWPVGAVLDPGLTAPLAAAPALEVPDPAVVDPAILAPGLPDESPSEARASEALLTEAERLEIQSALKWAGHYIGAIDGAFGPGTRQSMAAWQVATLRPETGILTTAERAALVGAYRDELAELGLAPLNEAEAGIEVLMPLALVDFAGYEPPFVRFDEKDGSGFGVLLISRPGDAAALAGLYDLLQSLEAMPLGGARRLGATDFEIEGANDKVQSHAQAVLADGQIKGFMLMSRPADAGRAARVLEAMRTSFRPVAGAVLDEGLGEPSAVAPEDLMAGLEVRRPAVSRSGFFVDAAGAVVTTDEVAQDCRRLTLDGLHEATVVARDAGLGLVLVRPTAPLAPRGYAAFRAEMPRPEAEVAVSGYSYEEVLDAPVMSFGQFGAAKGLNGEPALARLAVTVLQGDAGGPVLDRTGAVIGMLAPRHDKDGRVLPEDVAFAVKAEGIAAFLGANGVQALAAAPGGAMAPETLTRHARGLTVKVSCWN